MTECQTIDANNPHNVPTVVLPRKENVFYWLERHGNSYFFLIQDEKWLNSAITFAPIENPEDQTVCGFVFYLKRNDTGSRSLQSGCKN